MVHSIYPPCGKFTKHIKYVQIRIHVEESSIFFVRYVNNDLQVLQISLLYGVNENSEIQFLHFFQTFLKIYIFSPNLKKIISRKINGHIAVFSV